MDHWSASACAAAALLLAGCVQPGAEPPSRSTAMIVARAGAGCGPDGARHAAAWAAPILTLRSGYGGYVVLGEGVSDKVHAAGAQGTAAPERTVRPDGSTEADLLILMLHSADPDFAKATDARKALGPRWNFLVHYADVRPEGCVEPRAPV